MLYSSFSKRSLRTRYLASVFFAMLLLFLGCGKDPLTVYLENEQKTSRKNEIQKNEKESLAYWQKRSEESRNRETACQDGRRSEKKQAENKQREQSEQISLWKKNYKDCSGQLIICNGNHSTCADDLKKEKEKCKLDLDKEKAVHAFTKQKCSAEEKLKRACGKSFDEYRTTHPSKIEDCDPENPNGTVGKIVATLRKQINGLNNNVTTLTQAKNTAEDSITKCTRDKGEKVRECLTHAKKEKDQLEKAKDAIYANLKKLYDDAVEAQKRTLEELEKYKDTHPYSKEQCDPAKYAGQNQKQMQDWKTIFDGRIAGLQRKLATEATKLNSQVLSLKEKLSQTEIQKNKAMAENQRMVSETTDCKNQRTAEQVSCKTKLASEKQACETSKQKLSTDKQACETSKHELSSEKKQLTQAIQKCEGEKASWRKRAEQCGSGVSNCGNQLKTCEKDKKQLSIEKQELEKQKQAILEKYNSEKRSIENEKNQLIIQRNSCSNDKQNFQKKYNECLQTGITTRKSIENLNRKIALQESQCTEKEKRIKREEQINLQRCEFQKESIKKEKKSMRASFLASRKKELEQTQTILQQRLQKTSIIKEDASEKEKEKNKAEKDRITTRLEVVKKEIAKISTRPDVHPMIQHSDFWIDREEVTVRAFRQCQKPDCKQRLERSASPRCNMQEHQPIVCVAHQEAQTYCRSVGKRLCSREEWLEAANFLPGGWDASIEKASNPMYTPTDKGVLGMLNHIGEWVAYSNRGGYCAWIGRSNLDKELLEEECGNKDLEFVGFRCCKNN